MYVRRRTVRLRTSRDRRRREWCQWAAALYADLEAVCDQLATIASQS